MTDTARWTQLFETYYEVTLHGRRDWRAWEVRLDSSGTASSDGLWKREGRGSTPASALRAAVTAAPRLAFVPPALFRPTPEAEGLVRAVEAAFARLVHTLDTCLPDGSSRTMALAHLADALLCARDAALVFDVEWSARVRSTAGAFPSTPASCLVQPGEHA